MRSSLNILRFTALLFPIFMSTSCTDDPIEIPEPDTMAPQSMVLFPVDGESVSGEVIIQVRAVDNDRVDSVQFLINQVLVFTDSTDNDNIFTFKCLKLCGFFRCYVQSWIKFFPDSKVPTVLKPRTKK